MIAEVDIWIKHGVMVNMMNKERMLEDFLVVGQTLEAYIVASEGDT